MKATKFVRDAAYEARLVGEAFGRIVHKDAEIEITSYRKGGKYKAFCSKTNTYIQFPRNLRQPGVRYIADLLEQSQEGKETFYTAVKGSIRLKGSNSVIA